MEAQNQRVLEAVERLLGTLMQKEATVIDSLYGLRGQETKIVEQVAEDMNLSHGRIRQLYSAAMFKITLPSRSEITKELLRLDPEIFSREEINFPKN